jgi:clan AA aspartic protease
VRLCSKSVFFEQLARSLTDPSGVGKVMAKIKLTNLVDNANARRGLLEPSQIRTLEMEGLVDTGATTLVIPVEVAEALGLPEVGRRSVRLADGSVHDFPQVSELHIEILGRGMACDAIAMPTKTLLIGQIPLEGLDLVIDPKSRDVTVNPESPDVPMFDALSAARESDAEARLSARP